MKPNSLSGFDGRTGLPKDEHQHNDWQTANRSWWEDHPMQYDWRQGIEPEKFSPEYYLEIDRRFLSLAAEYLPPSAKPFGGLIPYHELPQMDVLEIGVGCGTHAALLASHARSFTGIDLTEHAIECTTRRLQLFGISADVRRVDAEAMPFEDGSFDFVWSWGVIHHSADTRRVLSEMRRVLRPGGRAVVMVYCRNLWNYYLVSGIAHGILRGMLFKGHSLNEIMQIQTDGALARFYTKREWREEAAPYLSVERMQVFGQKTDLLPLPACALKNKLARMMPANLGRLFTHELGWGNFLVAHMRRP